MDKCTPGPWYAMTGDTGGIIDQATVFSEHETNGEPTYIADTMGVDDEVPLEQRKANAHLIAAAREMLAALKRQVANVEHWLATDKPAGKKESKSIYEQMVAAIAKAEGRS